MAYILNHKIIAERVAGGHVVNKNSFPVIFYARVSPCLVLHQMHERALLALNKMTLFSKLSIKPTFFKFIK
jgi:hypothetical protein